MMWRGRDACFTVTERVGLEGGDSAIALDARGSTLNSIINEVLLFSSVSPRVVDLATWIIDHYANYLRFSIQL